MVSALWKAAGDGDVSRVQEMLKEATNVDIELKGASSGRFIAFVSRSVLIAAHSKISGSTAMPIHHTGVTPLIQAVRNGHGDIVKELLAHGADPANSSSQGRPETYTQDEGILEALRRSAESRPPVATDGTHQNSSPAPPQHDGSLPQQQPQNGYPTDPAAAAAYEHAMRSAGYWYMPPPNGIYAPYGYMAPPPPEHMMQAYYGAPPTMQNQPPPPQQQHSPNMSRNPDRQESNGSNGHGSLPPAEVAKVIPCRYFPMCKYGSDCMFAHPQVPYFNGHTTSPQIPYPPPTGYDAHVQPMHYSPPNGYYGVPPTPQQYTQSPNGLPTGAPQPHSPVQHTTSHAPSPHAPPYIPQSEQQQSQQQQQPLPQYAYLPPTPQQNGGVVSHVPLSPVASYHPGAVMSYPAQSSSPVHHRPVSQSNGYVQQQSMVSAPQMNGLDENHVMKQAYEEGGQTSYYGNNGGRGEHNGAPRRGGGGVRRMNGRNPPPPCLFFPAGKCKNGDNCRFPHIRPEDDPDAFPEGFPPTTYPQRARSKQSGGHYSTRTFPPREDLPNGDPNGHVPRPFMNGNGHVPHMNGFRKNSSPDHTNDNHQNRFGTGHNGRHHNGNNTHHTNGTNNGLRLDKVNGVNGGVGRNNGHGHGTSATASSSPVREVVLTPADFPSLKGSTEPTPTPTTPNTPNGLGGGLTAAQVLKGNAAARAKLLNGGGEAKASADEMHLQEAMAKVSLESHSHSEHGKVGKSPP
ncbi:hypothetical protein FRB98_000361 [Tulasnella sp. 332]|nr:hypothetical protein FRB98_000361 [Tulasnella sp. 332]